MPIPQRSLSAFVIVSPSTGTPDHTVEVPGCLITAYGTSTNPLAKVCASVGQWPETNLPSDPEHPSVSQYVEGFVSGCAGADWCFEKRGNDDRRVPGARGCGLVDMLVVWGYEEDGGKGSLVAALAPLRANATFRGVGGCCSGSGDGVGYDAGPLPLFAVAPRFVTVMLAPGKLSLTEESEILLLGGLLRRSAVTLVYDPYRGSPNQPVWRNADGAADGGEWTLQVASDGGALRAQLTFQRVTPTEVMQPLAWTVADWDFSGTNTLTSPTKLASGRSLPRLNVAPSTKAS